MFFARMTFLLGCEDHLRTADNCSRSLVIGGIQAKHQRRLCCTWFAHQYVAST